MPQSASPGLPLAVAKSLQKCSSTDDRTDDSNLLQASHAANSNALTVLHTQAQAGSTDVLNSNISLVPIRVVTAMVKSIQPTVVDAHLSLGLVTLLLSIGLQADTAIKRCCLVNTRLRLRHLQC